MRKVAASFCKLVAPALLGLVLHSVAQASPVVMPNDTYYFESGIILGRPVKMMNRKGVLIRTWEGDIQIGEFADDSKYIGTSWDVSIPDSRPQLVEQFNKLDTQKNYVFSYDKNEFWSWRWNTMKSNYFLSKIEETTPREALKEFKVQPVSIQEGRHGGYSTGGSRTGRIISVERWGRIHRKCALELALGGIVAGEKSSDINSIEFWTGSEEACHLAETVLRLQIDVKVDYEEAMFGGSMFERYSHIARRITPLIHPSVLATGKTARELGLSEAQLQQIKAALLKDPEFIREVGEAVKK